MPEPRALTESQAMRLTKPVIAKALVERDRKIDGLSHQLIETMQNLDMLMDNRGWVALNTLTEDEDGPSLKQVQDASLELQNLASLNGLVKRGLKLRTGNVLNGGVHYDNIEGAKQGKGINVQARIDDEQNQDAFFGQTAREQREACYYTGGIALWIGDDEKRTLEQLPIGKITHDYRNPDNPAEIWAVRKAWMRVNPDTLEGEQQVEWYYTNRHFDKRRTEINFGNNPEPVSQTKRVFGIKPVNSMTGWAYGVPDALPMITHVRQYLEAVNSGKVMSDSMAKLAYTAKVNTQTGADKVGVKIATTGAGGTVAIGQTNELQALSTAGRGYDFASLVPLLALAATSIETSVISLSSNTANAGSSYGAAQTLSKPEKDATAARRQFWIELDKEVLKWLGAKAPEVWFDSLEDMTAQYRATQAIMLKWSSGLYKPEQIKRQLEEIWGRNEIGEIPADVLIPNVASSLARKDVDTDGTASPNATTNGGGFASGQGQSSAANAGQGTSQNANDVRAEAFFRNLERFGEQLDRWEAEGHVPPAE